MSNQETTATDVKLDVRAYPIKEPKSNIVAFASATINDIFAVQGIKVINGEKGLFASMPSVKDSKGEYKDVCFPVTADFRSQLNTAVLNAYKDALEKGPQEKASVSEQIKEGAKATKDKQVKEKPASGKTDPEH